MGEIASAGQTAVGESTQGWSAQAQLSCRPIPECGGLPCMAGDTVPNAG
jgi:hypothetical protein